MPSPVICPRYGIKSTARAAMPKSAGVNSRITTKNANQLKIWLPQSQAAFQATLRTRERSLGLLDPAPGFGAGSDKRSVSGVQTNLRSTSRFILMGDQGRRIRSRNN